MPVEVDKALVGELSGRAQLAGAERGRRPADAGQMRLSGGKPVGELERLDKAHPLDGIALHRFDPAGILECVGDKAEIAGLEELGLEHWHLPQVS